MVIYRVLRDLMWCALALLAMLMQPCVRSRHFFTFLALIGTLAGTAASVTAAMHAGPGFGGLVQSDSFSFFLDRKSTRLNSSHSQISYAVFCLKKKNKNESIWCVSLMS